MPICDTSGRLYPPDPRNKFVFQELTLLYRSRTLRMEQWTIVVCHFEVATAILAPSDRMLGELNSEVGFRHDARRPKRPARSTARRLVSRDRESSTFGREVDGHVGA